MFREKKDKRGNKKRILENKEKATKSSRKNIKESGELETLLPAPFPVEISVDQKRFVSNKTNTFFLLSFGFCVFLTKNS